MVIVRLLIKKAPPKKNQSKIAKSKSLISFNNYDFILNTKNIDIKLGFFYYKARLAFKKLKQVFIKLYIFFYLDIKCHIKIQDNISSYIISQILKLVESK